MAPEKNPARCPASHNADSVRDTVYMVLLHRILAWTRHMLCRPGILDFASQLTSSFCVCGPYRVHVRLHAVSGDLCMGINDVSRMEYGDHLRPSKSLIADIADVWFFPGV